MSYSTEPPRKWGVALMLAGCALWIFAEAQSLEYAAATANWAPGIWGFSMDAPVKLAASVLVGIGSFGGGVVAAWMHAEKHPLRWVATGIVAIAFIMSCWNFSSARSFDRMTLEASTVKASAAYAPAQLLFDKAMAQRADATQFFDADVADKKIKLARETLDRAIAPTKGKPAPWDWFWAVAVHGLAVAFGACFRIGASVETISPQAKGWETRRANMRNVNAK